jgi:hypothetical protein
MRLDNGIGSASLTIRFEPGEKLRAKINMCVHSRNKMQTLVYVYILRLMKLTYMRFVVDGYTTY